MQQKEPQQINSLIFWNLAKTVWLNIKARRRMRIFIFFIFGNLIDMKLYSLLILTENTNKSKKQF